MTIEEAIRILDPKTSLKTLAKYPTDDESINACNEACRMAVDELRKHQWISVEDSLPASSQDRVLIATENGVFYGFYAYSSWFAYGPIRCEVTTLKLPVTHWQPLPEPPKAPEVNADILNITRFTEAEISRAINRTGLERIKIVRILSEWDKGIFNIDDIIDAWENEQ